MESIINDLPEERCVYTTQLKIALKWLWRHYGFKAKNFIRTTTNYDKTYTIYEIGGLMNNEPIIYKVYVRNNVKPIRRC